MDEVELRRAVEHRPHRQDERKSRRRPRSRPARSASGTVGTSRPGDLRVADGERRDLVAAAVELADELEHDAFGAAVARAAGRARWAGRPGRCGAVGHRDPPRDTRPGPRSGPTVAVAVPRRPWPAPCVSGRLGPGRRVALLDLFLGLVADTGAAGRADGATDDRAGRPGDRATERRTGGAAAQRAGAGAGLVVALGRLAGHRAADRTDAATDDRADRPADGHPDGGAAERAGAGADGLLAVLLVLGSGAVGRVRPGSASCRAHRRAACSARRRCVDRSGPLGPPDRWEPGQGAGPATSNDVDGPTVWRRHDGRCHSRPRGRIRHMTKIVVRRAGPGDGPGGASEGERIGLVRVDAELTDRLGRAGRGQRTAAHQPDEGRGRDVSSR